MMTKAMQTYLAKATNDNEYKIKLAEIKIGTNSAISADLYFVGSKIRHVHMIGTVVVIE